MAKSNSITMRKASALFFAFVLAFSLFPASALAAGDASSTSPTPSEDSPSSGTETPGADEKPREGNFAGVVGKWKFEPSTGTLTISSAADGASPTLSLPNEHGDDKKIGELFKDSTAQIRSIVFTGKVRIQNDSLGMFSGLPFLETVDFSGLDLSSVSNETAFEGLFKDCPMLQSVDLSVLDTSKNSNRKIKSMRGMFEGCTSLKSVNLSGLFNTSYIEDMSNLFNGCYNLEEINLSGLNTSKVTDMSCMFQDCEFLTKLDLSSFNTSKVKNMQKMFYNCIWLEDLNISSFNTANVENMFQMFQHCTFLTKLDVSSFNTAKVKDISHMFAECVRLTELDLSSFDTSNVEKMNQLFYQASALEQLDLTSFDTSNVTESMDEIFFECEGLRVVKFGPRFSFTGKDLPIEQGALLPAGVTNDNLTNGKWLSAANDKLLKPEEIRDTHAHEDTYFKTDIDIKYLTIDPIPDTIYYDGTIKSPVPRVTLDGFRELKVGMSPNDTDADVYVYYIDNRAACDDPSKSDKAPRFQIFPTSNQNGSYFTGKSDVITFKILSKPISSSDIKISSIASVTYNGKAQTPRPTVTYNGTQLRVNSDYRLYYSNNINQGTATVRVVGLGNYSGEKSITFKISPKSIADANVQIPSIAYTGSARQPEPKVTDGSTTLVRGKDYTVEYSNNVQPGTNATATIKGIGNYTGSKKVTFQITGTPSNQGSGSSNGSSSGSNTQQAEKQPVYRLYNPNSSEHFYTLSAAERDALKKAGWKDEGIAWQAPKTSKTPVYRLYNPNAGDHHYTTSAGERDALVKVGWRNENICWYSDDAKGVPVYRVYNPNAKAGAHHYTINKNEYDSLVKLGWKAEGIGWYGVKS